jgi:hypothetical protein
VSDTVEPMKLTALDRCDRCGAQAYVQVKLVSGLELLFCAHHARVHGDYIDQLILEGAVVRDESGRLASSVST